MYVKTMSDPPTHEPASQTRVEEPSPSESIRYIERGFYGCLRSAIAATELPDDVEALVRARLEVRRAQCRHLVANELDEANVRFTLLAVALFDVGEPILGRARATRLVDDCRNQPLRGHVVEGTRQLLDGSDDAFRALVDVSKAREHDYFGPSFEFSRLIDDDVGYVLQISRCLFHEVLRACGRTELQPILCRFDLNWIDAVDRDRHGIAFVRPCTFATASRCQFWFARTDGDVASRLPVLHAT
jgi:hypothetical protein